MWRDVGGMEFQNFRICMALQKKLSCSLKLIRLIDAKNNYVRMEVYLKTRNKFQTFVISDIILMSSYSWRVQTF
jgi:hypothetical protein